MSIRTFWILLRSYISFFLWMCISILLVLTLVPLACLPAPWRYKNRLYFALAGMLCRWYLHAGGISLSISGQENLPGYGQEPAIIIANHSSALDIPVVDGLIGSYPHIWICKQEYSRVPFMGFVLKRMHTLVDRSNPRQATAALIKTIAVARQNSSHVVLFPEGTRHTDGAVHPFHPGFAILAKKLNRPVIPIFIVGLHKIFPKKSLRIDSSHCPVTIVVGSPMLHEQDESTEQFAARVQTSYNKTWETLNT